MGISDLLSHRENGQIRGQGERKREEIMQTLLSVKGSKDVQDILPSADHIENKSDPRIHASTW